MVSSYRLKVYMYGLLPNPWWNPNLHWAVTLSLHPENPNWLAFFKFSRFDYIYIYIYLFIYIYGVCILILLVYHVWCLVLDLHFWIWGHEGTLRCFPLRVNTVLGVTCLFIACVLYFLIPLIIGIGSSSYIYNHTHENILASTLKTMYNSEIQHYTISTIHSGSNIHVSSICQINRHITSWVQVYL